MKYAVSACLMGENCKYSGGNNFHKALYEFLKDKEYLCVCPEVLGGLATPRACCEIVNNKIMNSEGVECTDAFVHGANLALDIIKKARADIVILQPRSPSCGIEMIYDGTFSGRLIAGSGVFAKLLSAEGIPTIQPDELQTLSSK